MVKVILTSLFVFFDKILVPIKNFQMESLSFYLPPIVSAAINKYAIKQKKEEAEAPSLYSYVSSTRNIRSLLTAPHG